MITPTPPPPTPAGITFSHEEQEPCELPDVNMAPVLNQSEQSNANLDPKHTCTFDL